MSVNQTIIFLMWLWELRYSSLPPSADDPRKVRASVLNHRLYRISVFIFVDYYSIPVESDDPAGYWLSKSSVRRGR